MDNSPTKKLVIIALSAAMLTSTKMALAMIPNVEVVTLLIIVFSGSMRLREVILTATVFCTIEMLIFGVNTWVISYYIYWNLLAFVAHFITRLPKLRHVSLVIMAAVMSTLFGVITTLVDTGLFTGNYGSFFYRFYIMYLRGGYFYLAHILSNIFIVAGLYIPVDKLYRKCYNSSGNGILPKG